MDNRSKFQRSFLIFRVEDKGFGYQQDPSGYVRVEAKDGMARIYILVQNIDEREDRNYKAYMLKRRDERLGAAVLLGILAVKHNRAEFEAAYDMLNVAGSGIQADHFDAVVVVAESREKAPKTLGYPLVAYRSGSFRWREELGNRLQVRLPPSVVREEAGPEKGPTQDAISRYAPGIESKYPVSVGNGARPLKRDEETEEARPKVQDHNSLLERTSRTEKVPELREDPPVREELKAPEPAAEDFSAEIGQDESQDKSQDKSQESPVIEESSQGEAGEMNSNVGKQEKAGSQTPGAEKTEYHQYMDFLNRSMDSTSASRQPDAAPVCPYGNGAACSTGAGTGNTTFCEQCQQAVKARGMQQPDNRAPADPETLKAWFEKVFEPYNPFDSKRRDYQWWKVNSPVYLNNVLYQCNTRTPLLFNPAVMMSHFKYRHLIIGIYSDRVNRREYLVCGIPGVYGIDDRPFGDLCRWVQLEGNRPRYGAFGYWLVYMDFKTGKLLDMK